MGKTSIICVIIVFALLLEDSSSVRKKTEDERKEDEEIAEKVNATLAAEEAEKKKEEDQKKKKENGTKIKKQDEDKRNEAEQKDQDEACPICNCTCPVVSPCLEVNCTGQCGTCPDVKPCAPCPGEKPCPKVEDCLPCTPCGPCPMANNTVEAPHGCQCPEGSGLSLPMAMAVGAVTGLVITGVVTIIGLVIRYVPPTISGFLFVATIIIVWYLSSHYPDTARELGGRVVDILREATTTLSHRVMEALQRHRDQVGLS
jgi:hypothetical protein